MPPVLKLIKLDCARRQLEIAIELYFMERDPVSIHTLAGAVYQLLADLNKHRGGKPMLAEPESLKGIVIPGKEIELSRMMSKAENFFKHADRDPEEVIDFHPEANEHIIWEACIKYAELAGEQTPGMQAMNLWFQVRHPEVFTFEQWRKDRLKQAQLWMKTMTKGQFYKEFIGVALLRGRK